MGAAREKPVLIFDGDCGFCKKWISRWKAMTGDAVRYAPYQEVGADFPQIKPKQFERAVQFVDKDGKAFSGAHAVFKALAVGSGQRWLLKLYEKIPLWAKLTEKVYALVASQRVFFSRMTRLLWGQEDNDVLPESYQLTRWLFLKGLGVVYGIAFISLWVQISGLVGSKGILPSPVRDIWIQLLCAGGTAASFAIVAGLVPLVALVVAWANYFLLAELCRNFLWFQWDSLLLEMGFLAILFVPFSLSSISFKKLGSLPKPSALSVWLLRWLLFRLIFFSGLVKLLSGDPTWRDFSALFYHYETQPLPTWIGWYANQLPAAFHKFSVGAMFFVELVVAFFVFLPRRPRIFAFFSFITLQFLIDLTGNYGFFGIQTLVLSFILLDDTILSRFLKKLPKPAARVKAEPKFKAYLIQGFAIWVLLATLFRVQLAGRLASEFRIINNYGVFAVMTTLRPEIIIEGSEDGKTWKAYDFKYKPDDLKERPRFVEPHMPRLDWQMWFAALTNFDESPWLSYLMFRLLQGSPQVLALFANNPFPNEPPRYLRALIYEYEFTDPATRRATGQWWQRTLKGNYSPVLSLRE